MRFQRRSNGQFVDLDPTAVLGTGGEANIYPVPQDPWLAAKVYHNPTDERARKLAVMVSNPPRDPMAIYGRISISWPVDILLSADGKRRFAGFLMPMVTGMRSIFDFYNPSARRKCCPLFNYRYLYRAARNLASAVRALHERGYVIGDVNESNILVAETALVTLVDTDSFQVRDPHTGDVYRCIVGKPEFTPPELQGKAFAEFDRIQENDLFGLAVLIFQLLMEGTHPYAGMFEGEGDPPAYQERILTGHSPYIGKRRVPYHPSPNAPPFKILHPALQKLFIRCFKNGRRRPKSRPDAYAWLTALDEAEEDLITCLANDQHLYSQHLKKCPWCERTILLGGRDPFPSRQSVEGGQHLKPIPPIQKTSPKKIHIAPEPTVAKVKNIQSILRRQNFWTWTIITLSLLSILIIMDFYISMPWWLSFVFAVSSGAGALTIGLPGWQKVRELISHGRRLRGVTLAIGITAILALMLAFMELFILFSRRLYLTTLSCGLALIPIATAYGLAGWEKVKALARQSDFWSMSVSFGLMIIFMLACGQLYGALLVYTVLVIVTTGLAYAFHRHNMKMLFGSRKWIAGLALGAGTAIMLALLLSVLMFLKRPL